MEQKHELDISSLGEHPQVTKSQQLILNMLGNYAHPDIEYLSSLTEVELNKAHRNEAFTCSSHFSLFKPNFKSELTNKLLVCVAWGNQDEVEKLLKTSPELMLEKTTFTDCSGRTFSNISAFEFVLWALDTRYMVNMMFNCLPKDEMGLKLAQKLEEQYYNHQEHGVTYTLEGQIINEKHFDFSFLIKALQDYVDNYDNWTGSQREAHWCKVVGMAQCSTPAHIIQHYCEPNVPFYPLPTFTTEQFVRTLKFYNYVNNKEMTWAGVTPTSDSVLGENFGIASGPPALVCGCALWSSFRDLTAISALCKVRTSDYLAIPSKLVALFDKKAAEDESPNNCLIS